MPTTNERLKQDLEDLKRGMMEAGDRAGAKNLRWRLRKGTLREEDLVPWQRELLERFPEAQEE